MQGINKIEVIKSKEKNVSREVRVYLQGTEEPVIIGINKNNQIVKYKNENITNIGDNFLVYNESLTQLELPNLTQVGDEFLYAHTNLSHLELPNLTQVGDNFLYYNKNLSHLELPNLTQVGDLFLVKNKNLSHLELPMLPEIERKFSDIIQKNKRIQRDGNIRRITPKNIAELDRKEELTTSDIIAARNILEDKQIESSKEKDN